MKKSPLVIIFMTVFIYLVGFGMIIPVLPSLSLLYGASSFEVGLIMATYSFFQFLCAPFWGRLSDKIGRRPVLLACLFGEFLTFIGLAYADSFTLLVVFRSLAGVFGGSISTATAYVADVTDKKDRSKSMGMIGAAFGIGFVVGPVIGGVLISVGNTLGKTPPFGLNFPSLAVAFLCLMTFLFAWFRLPESHRKEQRGSRIRTFSQAIRSPLCLVFLISFFVTSFAMANIEPTLFLLVFDRFQWDGETASYAFGYIGIMMAFTQGFLLRKLLPIYGERSLLIVGLIILMAGFSIIGIAHDLLTMTIAVTFVALGIGLANPSLMGSLSASVDDSSQGEIFGVTQSLSALGRILGPLCGGWMYGRWGQSAPFFFAGAVALVSLLLILSRFTEIPSMAKKTKGAN